MGAFTSCSVCHFSARALAEKSPRDQVSAPSLASRRVVSDRPPREKSRQ